jgi:hypothetical protein
MNISLKIILIIVSLFIFFSTIKLVRNNKIPIKYSLVWLFSGILLLFVACFPNMFGFLTGLIGFEVSSNLVIGIFITILLLITRMLTKIVSEQNKKINILIQEVSLLKKENNIK